MNRQQCCGYFSLDCILHNCGIRCAVLLIGIGVLGCARVRGAPLTYDVGVINMTNVFSPGSMPDYVVTGTITTNGTIGYLGPSDFISWSITVNGPRPYTFHHGNPGAVINPTDVYASSTTLETSGQFVRLWFLANENTLPSCAECRQNLGWRGFAGDVLYYSYDSADNDPAFASAVCAGST